VLSEFAPTTLRNWPVWFLTAMLGSSSYGKRLAFPVTLKLFVKRLGGEGKGEACEISDPNLACA
jgi:hypothetical protein